jgi:hypothetical protein
MTLQMDSVLGGYDAAHRNYAIVFDHNGGLTRGVAGGDVEPYVLANRYRITETNPRRPLPAHLTREMKRDTTAY